MKLLFAFVVVLLSCLVLRAQHGDIANMEKRMAAGMATNEVETVASDNFKIHFYQCWWSIDPNVDYITGKVTAHFIITQQANSIVFDLNYVLTVDSVMQRDTRLLFAQSQNESLTLQFNKTYNVGDEDSVTIYYQGIPPPANQTFVQSTHAGAPIIWTLSEPYGAKDWWPCRNGLDDKADSLDVHITYPSQYVGTSNGVWQGDTTYGNTTTRFFKHRYPIASYLVAIAVSNYSVFYNTVPLGSDTIPVVSYVFPESLSDFLSRTSLMLNGMKIYYSFFGAYPFAKEKYGQTQFGYSGGMEHQTNSFVGGTGENLMVHELAHQWFGDKVTLGSWQDIWLNEGFAVYLADMLYTQTLGSVYYGILVSDDLASVVSQPNGSVWVNDTTSFDRIFDERLTYNKGAFLVRMLRWTLGDSAFFNGVRNYLNDPQLAYSFARTIDLQHHLEQAGHVDLNYFFQQWFYGQGYPSITVKWQQNVNNYAQVNINQVTSDTSVSFFKVPLALTFKNSTQSKTFVVNDSTNNLNLSFNIGFVADTVLIDSAQQIISANNTSIKLTEATNTNQVSVYPNPFAGVLTVDIKNPAQQQWQVILYSAGGGKILTNTFTTTGGDIVTQIPLPLYLAKGVYFLKIDAGNVHVLKKLVKG